MIRKLAAIAGASALLMGSALPAFANGGGNVAIVTDNATIASANTGGNGQGNSATVKKAGVDKVTVKGNNTMTTGNAKASASSLVAANITVGCGCEEDDEHYDSLNGGGNTGFALVKDNTTLADANTGDNGQGNSASVKKAHADDVKVEGNNTLTTGKAKAKAKSWTVVNTNVNLGGF